MSNKDYALCPYDHHKLGRRISANKESHSYVTQCPVCKRYLLVTYPADGSKPTVVAVPKDYEEHQASASI